MLLTAASACATSRVVSIHSNPAGAEIFVDERSVGRAPVEARVDGRWIYQAGRARHRVTATAPGYQSGLYYLEPDVIFLPGAISCLILIGCPWAAQIPAELNLTLHPSDGS